MKLTVLLPAYNEEASIRDVLSRIPPAIQGIDSISVVVIDDGSTERTADIGRESGAHVISTPHLGLAAAFRTGLAYALKEHADLIATLDADGQYAPEELPLLLSALRRENAALVVGDRQVWRLSHMTLGHRLGNVIGSAMLRLLGTTGVSDASSGFRMFTRAFGQKLRITSEHTYTHEMLIQASAARVRTVEVPVTFAPRLHGRSKLVRSLHHHIFRSFGTILRSLFLYHPLRKFLLLAAGCFGIALVIVIVAFIHDFPTAPLVASGIFVVLGIQFVILGLLADAQAAERRVLLDDSVTIV